MAVITTDFGSIQTRNIDPHSPVTSENHNKLLKTFGTSNMYVKGFDATFYVDSIDGNDRILVDIEKGTAFVQYMVIETTSAATLEVSEIPTNAKNLCIVLEYTYRAIKPVPIAYLKVIREENFNPVNQLKLYSLDTSEWTSLYTGRLIDWLYTQKHLTDHRTDFDYTPYWANATYLRIDGSNIANGLRINTPTDADGTPSWDNADGDLVVNKDYVDNMLLKHSYMHDDYFVKKWHEGDNVESDHYGKISEPGLDVYNYNPYLKLSDMNDEGNGLKITASSNTVEVELSKSTLQIKQPGFVHPYNGSNVISEINSNGVTGAIWSDIAEYFDTDMTEMPEQGSCICIRNGKAVLSVSEADTSVIGCVSYKPAYILGGSTNFEKEFKENHKIPVAIIGQIRDVKVYSDSDIYAGALLISGKDGCFKAINPSMCNGSHIGKVLVPVHKGHGKYYCLIK